MVHADEDSIVPQDAFPSACVRTVGVLKAPEMHVQHATHAQSQKQFSAFALGVDTYLVEIIIDGDVKPACDDFKRDDVVVGMRRDVFLQSHA
jgi:hypothetical protein